MLGDQSAKGHTVFCENGGEQFVKTIAVGEYIAPNGTEIRQKEFKPILHLSDDMNTMMIFLIQFLF